MINNEEEEYSDDKNKSKRKNEMKEKRGCERMNNMMKS